MGMREELEAAGNWLFRRRGHLPLLLFPVLLIAAGNPGRTTLGVGWEPLCVALALGGLAWRAVTVGYVPKDTSQRNSARPQAEALNTTGLYSVVRHPLYFGNYLMWFGVALFSRAWWAPVIVYGRDWSTVTTSHTGAPVFSSSAASRPSSTPV